MPVLVSVSVTFHLMYTIFLDRVRLLMAGFWERTAHSFDRMFSSSLYSQYKRKHKVLMSFLGGMAWEVIFIYCKTNSISVALPINEDLNYRVSSQVGRRALIFG